VEILTVFRCDECGFDNATMSNDAIVDAIASFSVDADALTDERPSPAVWSPREYAWHMASVFAFYAERIELVLSTDRPQLEARDFTVDPGPGPAPDVDRVVTRLRALTSEQWQRVGIASGGDAERDIRNLASRLAHECVHHSLDMTRS
jgi:DinB family protein